MAVPSLDRPQFERWLFDVLPAAAPAWLLRQRWFGGKSRAIVRIAVDDAVWLPGPDLVALVVLQVTSAGDARPVRYAAVIGLAADAADAIARPAFQAGAAVVDLTGDVRGVRALLQGLVTAAPPAGVHGGVLEFDGPTAAARALLDPAMPLLVTPVGGEQSNTSLRLGSAHVFKLFRRLEAGLNPQLEVGRFLAGSDFAAVPRLEGAVRYRGRDGSCALGALEAWVENEGDGWRYVLGALALSTADLTSRGSLLSALADLGTTTAQFHAALARTDSDPAFSPEAVTPDDIDTWNARIAAQTRRTVSLLERPDVNWPAEAHAAAAEVMGSARRSGTSSRALAGLPNDFRKIRIHGDYHLGQTLKTDRGFVIIDFEGEPTKPLDERRQKQCALRDVAGMLRSIDYAVAAAAVDPALAPDLVAAMRSAFLDAYLQATTGVAVPIVPADPRSCLAWLSVLELEKALYEVEYEANSRPAWLPIPLRAVARLMTPAA